MRGLLDALEIAFQSEAATPFWRGADVKGLRHGIAVGVVGLATFGNPIPASAHEDGKVELYVAKLDVEFIGASHHVRAVVVDEDSGELAPDFEVVLSGSGGSTGSLAPVMLSSGSLDIGYYGEVSLSPGLWHLVVNASQGNSVIPALASARTFSLTVANDGRATMIGHGRSWWPFVLAIAAAVVLVAGGAALVLNRQRGFGNSTARRGDRRVESQVRDQHQPGRQTPPRR